MASELSTDGAPGITSQKTRFQFCQPRSEICTLWVSGHYKNALLRGQRKIVALPMGLPRKSGDHAKPDLPQGFPGSNSLRSEENARDSFATD